MIDVECGAAHGKKKTDVVTLLAMGIATLNDTEAEAKVRPCIEPIRNMKAIQSTVIRAENAPKPYKKYLEQ